MKLHEFTYLLGRGSLVDAKKTLRGIGKGADVAVYIERLDLQLEREIRRWMRKMLLASLKGKDPATVEMPATMRPVLLRSYISSSRKLVVSDSQIAEFSIVEELPDEGEVNNLGSRIRAL